MATIVRPMTNCGIPSLSAIAAMDPEKVKEIWKQQSHKDELLGILTKLYMKPLEDLMAEPEGEEETETPTWETV